MSLTSYRAALPRAICIAFGCVACFSSFQRVSFLSRSGGDLLSHVLGRSTIGATALNGRVRDGIGCFARAMTTRPGKKRAFRCGLQRGDVQVEFVNLLIEVKAVCLLPDQIKPIEPLVPVN